MRQTEILAVQGRNHCEARVICALILSVSAYLGESMFGVQLVYTRGCESAKHDGDASASEEGSLHLLQCPAEGVSGNGNT